MTDAIDFDPPQGATYHAVPLQHAAELPVLGVPVRFESNSAAVMAAVEESFGQWRVLHAHPELISPQGVRVRLIVHQGDEGAEGLARATFRVPDSDRMIVHTQGSVGVADAHRRDAVAYVTPALVFDRVRLRAGVIEALTLALLTWGDRHPVHASAVIRVRTALLLAGPPGTGKSTLAYVALRNGLRVLSDDLACVQVEPEFRVWGMPGRLYLAPDACGRFPELAGRSPVRMANSEEKVIVEIAAALIDSAVPVATRAGVCLLERKGGAASLVRVERAEVAEFLTRGLGPTLELHRATLGPAMQWVAARGGWRLLLSDDPLDAWPFIEEMLAELDRF